MKNKVYSANDIINLFKEIQSEEHYDGDDIATIICNKIIDKNKMSGDQEYFRFIYDVFDICKEYIKSTY